MSDADILEELKSIAENAKKWLKSQQLTTI